LAGWLAQLHPLLSRLGSRAYLHVSFVVKPKREPILTLCVGLRLDTRKARALCLSSHPVLSFFFLSVCYSLKEDPFALKLSN
jgi:hypothetical protein